MDAYKFKIKISDKGIISLPFEPSLYGQNAEIIVFPKAKSKRKSSYSAKDFLKKWSGILKTDKDLDTDKYDYLKNKHQ